METYVAGVAVAFVIGVWKLGTALSGRFSARAKNMARLGLHYRVGDASYQREGTGVAGWIAAVVWVLLVAPLGSWLIVASFAWASVKARRRPKELTKLFDVLDRADFTKEQLIELQEQTAVALGEPGAALAGDEDGDPSYLVLDDSDGFWSDVRVDPAKKTLVFNWHPRDHLSDFNSTEEYRLDGDKVPSRLLEYSVTQPGGERWYVKDGIVLETEIRKRAEEGLLGRTVDEELANLRERVQWSPIENLELRFFVMAQHPAGYPLRERRRLIRTELERLEAAARRVAADATAQGLIVEDYHLRYPESFTEADRKRVDSFFSDSYWAAAGIKSHEFYGLKEIRSRLRKLLGEKADA